jgi:PIN domain nuclease of toxin-antitoxin system
MSVYTTDTHPLIYYGGRNNAQLSDRARDAFEQADRGEAFILIPAPTLWEVSMLEQAGHISNFASHSVNRRATCCEIHVSTALLSTPRSSTRPAITASTTTSSTLRLSPRPSSATYH